MKISQCMIVKNEERNIEKALSWGKDIVCEQIVVDTGSTDRTVEIAEKSGAKVFNYKWTDDFSAAKNFAIEQACGDWIAFLDADEYVSKEDAVNLCEFLDMIDDDKELKSKYLAVFCPLINLRGDGSIINKDKQVRLFRNLPDIRYKGRIHEWLDVDWTYAVFTGDFQIIHTGYNENAYKETDKIQRNIKILRKEVLDNPAEMNYKAYLADALLASTVYGAGGQAELEEAGQLYKEVALSDSSVLPDLKKRACEYTKNNTDINQYRNPCIRLSQCMIVKNEERNIEKALSWGKDIVCEQIVVDTGSTDRTVEIAEKSGAKVFNYKWTDDFSAAKNFAIEQACGDWIAFLDADEYFPANEAAKLMPILGQIETREELKSKLAISCTMHQLDDNGKSMGTNMQVRILRNNPKVRYTGRIHEQLNIGAQEIIRTKDIEIMHTGYSASSYMQTDKIERNINMIKRELELNPDDLRMKMYLADVYISQAIKANDTLYINTARDLYKQVAQGGPGLDPEYRKTAVKNLMSKYSKDIRNDPELEHICKAAYIDFKDDHEIQYLYNSLNPGT